jgi:hypothetical protein
MDAVALLYRARHAGLRLEATGDTLKITGPKRAEPVVRLIAAYKSKVLAVLTATKNEPRYWHERLTARTFEWFNGTRSWISAQRLAWGDLENEWHSLYGVRWPAWRCPGCEKSITGLDAINLPDGNRVHFEPIECIIEFGRRWRGDARRALIALGVEPPDFEEIEP